MDTSVTGLVDVKTALDANLPIRERIRAKTVALGGKGTHYAAMSQADLVPMPKPGGLHHPGLLLCPVHAAGNGFDKKIDAMLADPAFRGDARTRDVKLSELRILMEEAPWSRPSRRWCATS